MSFTRYNTEDSVTSAEIVVRGAWTNDSNTLNNFFTSSAQSSETTKYFLNVYDTITTASLQFAVQYGHVSGSGSVYINSAVPGKTPTADVYGQYRNLIYGDENTNFTFDGTASADFWAINVARVRYKESIQPGSLTLTIGSKTLTDDSLSVVTTSYLGSNKYYNIVSGSGGTVVNNSLIYGYLFPDIGIILLHPSKLVSQAGITAPVTSSNTDGLNNTKLFASISAGGNFKLQSAETISSRYFFTRVKNQEYNYNTNPSIIDNQGNLLFSTLINNPQTFITTVGLYNDNNELLAVAKLSKPLVKDFTKELLVRVKLDY